MGHLARMQTLPLKSQHVNVKLPGIATKWSKVFSKVLENLAFYISITVRSKEIIGENDNII